MAPSSCVTSSDDDEEGERSEMEFSVDPSTDESLSGAEMPKGTPVVPDTSTSTKRVFKADDSSSSGSSARAAAQESPTKEAKDPSHESSDDMWATDSGDERAKSRISARLTSGRMSSGSGMESSSYVSFEAAEMDQIKRTQENASPPKPSPKLDERATATSTTPLLGTEKKTRSCCACVIA